MFGCAWLKGAWVVCDRSGAAKGGSGSRASRKSGREGGRGESETESEKKCEGFVRDRNRANEDEE